MLLAELAEEIDHRPSRLVAAARIRGAGEQGVERQLVVAVPQRRSDLLVVDGLGDRRPRQLVEELVDRRTGPGADELGDHLPVAEALTAGMPEMP